MLVPYYYYYLKLRYPHLFLTCAVTSLLHLEKHQVLSSNLKLIGRTTNHQKKTPTQTVTVSNTSKTKTPNKQKTPKPKADQAVQGVYLTSVLRKLVVVCFFFFRGKPKC